MVWPTYSTYAKYGFGIKAKNNPPLTWEVWILLIVGLEGGIFFAFSGAQNATFVLLHPTPFLDLQLVQANELLQYRRL
jgi:hypothetical protein